MNELMKQWSEVQSLWATMQQQYASANNAVASFHGRLSELQMSDADFDDKERAAVALAKEAKVVVKMLNGMAG